MRCIKSHTNKKGGLKLMLRVVSLFSGIGAFEKSLTNLNVDYEIVGMSEWDVNAIISYDAIHTNDNVDYSKDLSKEEILKELESFRFTTDGKKPCNKSKIKIKKLRQLYNANKRSKNLGDITQIYNVPIANLWTYSFPCFVAGTLVLTDKGFVEIESIREGDMVLTHNNRYMKVIKPMINKVDKIYKLSTMCSEELFVTEEHPFYVRKRYRLWNNDIRMYDRLFESPKWIPTKELTKDHYVGIATNQESKIPDWKGSVFKWSDGRSDRYSNVLQPLMTHKSFWYIIGRYMGDGWIRSDGGIIICDSDDKIYQITEKLDDIKLKYNLSKERTSTKVHIGIKEIGEYCSQFGKGAFNKQITSDILNLPVDLLQSFIEGYLDSDGCFINGIYKITTISKKLIYGIGQCVAKVYKRPFSIYKTKRSSTTIIEGRLVNQKDSYNITFKLQANKQDKAFYENGYIWCPINKNEQLTYNDLVYNMEVEEDNSYVVQNIIVHNCTDISIAGKQEGFSKGSGTRSGLLWEVERLLELSQLKNELPEYLLLENVKNLVGKEFKPLFEDWIEKLNELGYNTYWEVINSKNQGIPQNRERVFAVSIRKDIDNNTYKFPEPFDNGLRLKDFLESNVDEKYYISKDKTEKLIASLKEKQYSNTVRSGGRGSLDRHQWDLICENNCINTKMQNTQIRNDGLCCTLTSSMHKEPPQIPIQINKGNLKIKEDEICSCLNANYHKGLDNHAARTGIMENDCDCVGRLDNIKGHDYLKRVYSAEGCSPTVTTVTGGNQEIKILEDFYTNREIREYEDNCPTLRADRQGLKVLEENNIINGCSLRTRSYINQPQQLEIRNDELSNSITTVNKDSMVFEDKVAIENISNKYQFCKDKCMEFYNKNVYLPKMFQPYNQAEIKDIAPTLTTNCNRSCSSATVLLKDYDYRIRKLIPKECLKLMAFSNEDYEKIKATDMSDSAIYKQAGNSIVTTCLMGLFGELFNVEYKDKINDIRKFYNKSNYKYLDKIYV